MSNQPITQLKTLTKNTISDGDLIPIVDVSEITSPTGETKKISVGQLVEYIAAAVAARLNDA